MNSSIYISNPAQLKAALLLRAAMIRAEALTGASSPGGSGPSLYVDESNNQLQAAVITGDDQGDGSPFKVGLVPPGATYTDPESLVISLVTSADLDELPTFATEVNSDQDAAMNIGNINFVGVIS